MMNNSLRKDVTDEDLDVHMSQPLAEMMRSVVAWKAPSGDQSQKAANGPGPSQENQPLFQLTNDERTYLQSIHDEPNLTVTGRRNVLGWSTDRANKINRSLIEMGVVEPFTINIGGGTVKLLELSERGAEAVEVKRRFVRKGRVSAEHLWWQVQVSEHFRSEGYEAVIEKALNGQHADVGVFIDGSHVAYEVAISAQNEIRNIQKDLTVGFESVVVCCRDIPVRNAVANKSNEHLSPEQAARTRIVLLSDFSFMAKLFKPKHKGPGALHRI